MGTVDEGEIQTLRNLKILTESLKSDILLRFLQFFTLFLAVVLENESEYLPKGDVLAYEMKINGIAVEHL